MQPGPGVPSFFVFSWSHDLFPKNLLIVWVLCHFSIYINEADHPTPPFRDITKPLLIYLWVSQLALFQHHVTSVHNQLIWSKHGHQPIGSWACLSQAPSPPPTLTWSAKPTTPQLLPINGSYAPPQMSTWQHILSSPHLTDIFSHYCIAVNI